MDRSVNLTHTYTAWTRAWIEHMTCLDRSSDRTHDLHAMDPNVDRTHDLRGPERGSNTLLLDIQNTWLAWTGAWIEHITFRYSVWRPSFPSSSPNKPVFVTYWKDTYRGNKIGVINGNILLSKSALKKEGNCYEKKSHHPNLSIN